ncbi:MAG: hypothetical protein NVSMB57_01050 [Actinomycetota bacterium]
MSVRSSHSLRIEHVVALAFGITALAVRNAMYPSVFATALVGVAGIIPAIQRSKAKSNTTWLMVTAAGCAAFTMGRLVSGSPGFSASAPVIFTLMIAAVAEEAFFRRFLYGILAQRSTLLAISVSATLFALVHIPLYGIQALPIDLAAGLLLSWQRWASGSWTSPMASHMFVNLIQISFT